MGGQLRSSRSRSTSATPIAMPKKLKSLSNNTIRSILNKKKGWEGKVEQVTELMGKK